MGGRLGPGAAGRGSAGSVAAAPHSDPAWPLCGAEGTARPLALLSRDTHTYTERDTPLEDAQQCVGDIGQDHPGFCLISEVTALFLEVMKSLLPHFYPGFQFKIKVWEIRTFRAKASEP